MFNKFFQLRQIFGPGIFTDIHLYGEPSSKVSVYLEGLFGNGAISTLTKLFEEKKVDPNDPIKRKIDEVSKKLIQFADPTISYEVDVYHSPKANANAVLKQNKCNIKIYDGLWDPNKGFINRDKDDEIAVVVSHEIAHCTAHHGDVLSEEAQETSEMIRNNGFQGLKNGLAHMADVSRTLEADADKLSIENMQLAGYDTSYALIVWQRVADRMPKEEKDKSKNIYATHPIGAERVKLLEGALSLYRMREKLIIPSLSRSKALDRALKRLSEPQK